MRVLLVDGLDPQRVNANIDAAGLRGAQACIVHRNSAWAICREFINAMILKIKKHGIPLA